MGGEEVESMNEDNSQEAYLRLPSYLSVYLPISLSTYLLSIYLLS